MLAHSAPFLVGALEVRPPTREVIGPGGREVIEPRIMQVLVALHDAGGEIVSRDDLIGCCWDGRVVGDDAINRAISRLRRVGETTGAGTFRIETVTKVGYRLTAAEGFETPRPAAPEREDAARAGAAMTRRMLVGGGAAAAVLAAGGGWLWSQAGGSSQLADLPPDVRAEFARARSAWLDSRFEDAAAGYQRVVDVRPDFADGWGWLALTLEMGGRGQRPEAAELVDVRTRDAIARALAIDPGNAAALTAQGMGVRLFGDWLTAERMMRDILAREPQQVVARDYLTRVLEQVGRTRDALAVIEPYPDPFDDIPSIQYRKATMLWSAGRADAAERVIDRALARWPGVFPIWFSRYWLYVRTGRPQLALQMAERVQRPPAIPAWNFELNDLNARAVLTRAPADIQRAVAANRATAPRGAGFCENAIALAAQLNLLDEAFALTEAYYFGRGFRVAATRFSEAQQSYTPSYRRLTFFLFTPIGQAFRRDPRFPQLMEETGLASYWRRSGTRADVLA